MLINVYASDRGWLFEDLKEAFQHAGPLGDGTLGGEHAVCVSADPLAHADAWICIRTDELDRSPDPQRTILMVHDFWSRKPPGCADGHTNHAAIGAFSFVHPDQQPLYEDWFRLHVGLVRPIGARRAFALRESMPERFCVGWVGRNMRAPDGRDQKRPHLLYDALVELERRGVDCHCIALTPDVDFAGRAEQWRPDRGSRRTPSFDQLQCFYHSIDVLVVTCLPEPGPLSVFEALRCGVPVTIVGDGPQPPVSDPLAVTNVMGDLGLFLSSIAEDREIFFEGRQAIRVSMPYLQEDWIAANIKLAVEVAGG